MVVGRPLVWFTKNDSDEVLSWVESGGRLVIIDRNPDRRLLPKSGEWTISTHVANYPWYELDPTNLDYHKALRQALKAVRVVLDTMQTGPAVRTYNIMIGERRRVAAALIAVP